MASVQKTILICPFLRYYVEQGVNHVLCTDISRDGMLGGPATDLYSSVMQEYPTLSSPSNPITEKTLYG